MDSLKVSDFQNMMYETVNVIENNKAYLNYINVFPVRDGDTGSNLLKTFNETKKLENYDSVKDFLKDLKKYLLSNARGNSGVIMSQFYKGLCDYLIKCKTIGPKEFAKAIKKGYEKAYKSVYEPVEGTMLTVMRGASIGAVKALEKTDSIIDVLLSSFESAQTCLKKTMNKLPILKDSGVVDAGGLGVVYMLGAWLRAIGVIPKHDPSMNNMIVLKEKKVTEDEFCVNALLINCRHPNGLKQVLKSAGSSLQFAEDNGFLRVHLHTNDCETIKTICSAFGTLKSFEADNMRRQNEKIRKNNN